MSSESFSLGDAIYRLRRRFALLRRQLVERPAVQVGLLIALLALLAALGIHVVENEGPYASYLGTCRQVAILLFSGFDIDDPPKSAVCWGLMFLCVFLGIALLALLTADLATILVTAASTNRGRRRVRMRNHVVVCGWHYTARAIVEQLTSREHRPRRKIVVVDEQTEDRRLLDPDIEYVRGDPTEQSSLELARADRAELAIIPLDSSYSEDLQDSRITLTAMAVKSMNPSIYACVELLHPHNQKHIERTEADEVVCVGDFSRMMLSHAAVAHGVSRLFEEILTFNRGNEIHRIPLPESLIGKSFRWMLRELNQKFSCILLSVKRGNSVYTNPTSELILEKGDQLFVLAQKAPTNIDLLAK